MSNFLKKFNKFFLSRNYWSSLAITILTMMILQFVIYFGCKYDFFPHLLANIFLTEVRNSGEGGLELSDVTWRVPRILEFLFFCFSFLIVSLIVLKIKTQLVIKTEWVKSKKNYKIRLLLFLISYCVFLASDSVGRTFLYGFLPRSFMDSFVIDCSKKVIRLGAIKYSKEENYACPLFCNAPERKCIYKGLDKNQPQLGDLSGSRTFF